MLSSNGISFDWEATGKGSVQEESTQAGDVQAVTSLDDVQLPERLAARLSLTFDLDATRSDDATCSGDELLSAPGLLAGDTFSVTLPEGVSPLDGAATLDVYGVDEDGFATNERVATATWENDALKVRLGSDAQDGVHVDAAAQDGARLDATALDSTSLKGTVSLPVALDASQLADEASQHTWTLQTLADGTTRTAMLEYPSLEDSARALGLLVDAPAGDDDGANAQALAGDDPAADPVPTVEVARAPSTDRSASAQSFVTFWADNNASDRPTTDEMASRREYRLYFKVAGDDTAYPLTTDGRTISEEAENLLGMTQEQLYEIRMSSEALYGVDRELVCVDKTGTNEYTAASAAGLPSQVIVTTTTTTPATTPDGTPTVDTKTDSLGVTYLIRHETAGVEQAELVDYGRIYVNAAGDDTYMVMPDGFLDNTRVDFVNETLASVKQISMTVKLNVGAQSTAIEDLDDWLNGCLEGLDTKRKDIQTVQVLSDGNVIATFTGDELAEQFHNFGSTFVLAGDSSSNEYKLTATVPRYDNGQNLLDYAFVQAEQEVSNVTQGGRNYRDYYQVWYNNSASTAHGSDTDAAYDGGVMTVTHAGNTALDATKYWLDDDPSARPSTTYTLWRYSLKDGQSTLTASQVQANDGSFISMTRTAAQNAALGEVELSPAGIPLSNDKNKLELGTLFRERFGSTLLAKYDQDGFPYVYFVREEMHGGDYKQVMGQLDSRYEHQGELIDGSDAGPNYRNATFDAHVSCVDEGTTYERPEGDLPIFDGGTVTNVRSATATTSFTKIWDAAAYQDQLSDVQVSLVCSRILKEHATYNEAKGYWEPNGDTYKNDDGTDTYLPIGWDSGFEGSSAYLSGWSGEKLSQTATISIDKYDAYGREYVFRWVETNVEAPDEGALFFDGIGYLFNLVDSEGNRDEVCFVAEYDYQKGTVANRILNTINQHVDKKWAVVDEAGNVVRDDNGDVVWTQEEQPYAGKDVGSVTVTLVRDNEVIGDFVLDGKVDDDKTELKNPDGSAMMGESPVWGGAEAVPSTAQETSPWHLDFSNLPRFASDGHKYSYQVFEGTKDSYFGVRDYDPTGYEGLYGGEPLTTLYNTPGPGGELSMVPVSKRWLDGGNASARPEVKVGLFAAHDMSSASGSVSYKAGDQVGTAVLDDANEWYQELSVGIGGLGLDDFYIRELSTDDGDASQAVASGKTRVITKAEAQQWADDPSSNYGLLLRSWQNGADDSQRMLASDYAYEVSYGKNDVKHSLEVTNRRVGLMSVDIAKKWEDVGADPASRPSASFKIFNNEGKVEFAYDGEGRLTATVDGIVTPVFVPSDTSEDDPVQLTSANSEIADDGASILIRVLGSAGEDGFECSVSGLPKYDAQGNVLTWGISEQWNGDPGEYSARQTSYSERYGGAASPWHHADYVSFAYDNYRTGTKTLKFHTHWYDRYVNDTLNQRIDIYLSIYQRVRVYDENGAPAVDENGDAVYEVKEVPGYRHFKWEPSGEEGEDPLYNQFVTVANMPKYDSHGCEIVYYASVHHSQSANAFTNLDYDAPWFTYDADPNASGNNGYPGNKGWDDADESNPFKAGSPDSVISPDGDAAVREDGTFNYGLSSATATDGEKIWANVPGDFAKQDLPSITVYVQRRVSGGHYAEDGTWQTGGNDWKSLAVTTDVNGGYAVKTYRSGGTADYAVADGQTAVAWTSEMDEGRGYRFDYHIGTYGNNSGNASESDKDATRLPRYDRNGRRYEYRICEVIDGLASTDGNSVPGGFDMDDLDQSSPEELVSKIYTVRYGGAGSFRIGNVVNSSEKGRITVKKLFTGLEPGDRLPSCNFALYRYYVKADGAKSEAQFVSTQKLDMSGKTADDDGQFTATLDFDDLDIYTPAGQYWVYYVAEQPINGYRTSVGTGDLPSGSADLQPWGNYVYCGVASEDLATVPAKDPEHALFGQPTSSAVADDHAVDVTFENDYDPTDSQAQITGDKRWSDQSNVAGTRPESITLEVTRRYADGTPDVSNGGKVVLQSDDPEASNYLVWEKNADDNQNRWRYTISNLERISPDGGYWKYEVHEALSDGSAYSTSKNGGTVSVEGYDYDSPVKVADISNYLKTKAGFVKHWVEDAKDPWRQRPVTYYRLEASVSADGGVTWDTWQDAGAAYNQYLGAGLSEAVPYGNFASPTGYKLPSGDNTVTRVASDNQSEWLSFKENWKNLPVTAAHDGNAYTIRYRVVECRLVYEKKASDGGRVVDVASRSDDGAYINLRPYQPSQSTEDETNGAGDTVTVSIIANTLESTSISVAKAWDDFENAWTTRPGTTTADGTWSVTYVLQRRTAGDEWGWLTQYGATISAPFTASGSLVDSLVTNSISGNGAGKEAEFSSLPSCDTAGTPYEYRVAELQQGSYGLADAGAEVLATNASNSDKLVLAPTAFAEDGTSTQTFINKLQGTSYAGTKFWNDWGTGIAETLDPATAGIELVLQRSVDSGKTWESARKADGSQPDPTWTVNAGGTWTYSYADLPKCDQSGREYSYRAIETDGSVSGFFSDKGADASGTVRGDGDAPDAITNVATRFTFEKVGDVLASSNDTEALDGVELGVERNGEVVAVWSRSDAGVVSATTHVGGRLYTSDQGYIVGLPAGDYTVRETVVPAGHVKVADFTLTIANDGSISTRPVSGAVKVRAQNSGDVVRPEQGNAVVEVKDSVFRGRIVLKKFYRHGTAQVNVYGMTFDLYRVDGDGGSALVAAGIATDSNGSWTTRGSAVPVQKDTEGNSVLGHNFLYLRDGLPEGSYYLLETGESALTEKGQTQARYDFTVSRKGDAAIVQVDVNAENVEFNASATLDKANSETGAALDGARFSLYYTPLGSTSEKSLGTVETGRAYAADATGTTLSASGGTSGNLSITGLKKGSYRLVETGAVGYECGEGDKAPVATWTIADDDAGNTLDLANATWINAAFQNGKLVNDPKHGSISMRKTDNASTPVGIDGATFKLQRKVGDAWQDVTVDDAALEFVSGNAYVLETNSSGAISGISERSAANAGQIDLSNVPWGTYRFVEIKAAPGYSGKTGDVWGSSAEVTIDASSNFGRPVSAGDVRNAPTTLSIKKTNLQGDIVLPDAAFEVKPAEGSSFVDGAAIKALVTDSSGIAQPRSEADVLDGMLVAGDSYVVAETEAPAGYAMPAQVSVTISVADDGTIVLEGDPAQWSVADDGVTLVVRDKASLMRLRKVDENGDVLPGSAFTVTGRFAGSDGVVEKAIDLSDDEAISVSSGILLEGERYTFHELHAPAGYATVPDLVIETVVEDGDFKMVPVGELPEGWSLSEDGATLTAQDEPAEFYIEKVSAEGDGTTLLAGAQFSIEGTFVMGGEVVEGTFTGTSVDDGTLQVSGVIGEGTPVTVGGEPKTADGLYKITETTAPNGYELATASYTVKVARDGSVSVAGEGAAGWALDASTCTVTLSDTPIRLNFAKKSQATQADLDGAEFTIWGVFANADGTLENDGAQVSKTCMSLDALSSLRFVAGQSYYLEETKAPAGYELIVGKVGFKVDELGKVTGLMGTSGISNGSYGLSADGLAITARDIPIEFVISKVDTDGLPLAGARFSLSPDSGSTFADGSTSPVSCVTDEEGIANETVDGRFFSTLLVAGGTYVLTEVEPPAGHLMFVGSFRLKVGADGQLEGLSEYGEFENADITVDNTGTNVVVMDYSTSLFVFKYASDKVNEHGSPVGLAGAVFSVTPAEGSSFANPETIEGGVRADGSVLLSSDDTGFCGAALTGHLNVGHTYILREVTAPAGYALLDGELALQVQLDGALRFVGDEVPSGYRMNPEGEIVTFSGDVFDDPTKLLVSKADAGNALVKLGGATFELSCVDGATFADGSAEAREVTTSADDSSALFGMAEFDRGLLRADNSSVYALRETLAPAGYELNDQTLCFRLATDGSVVPLVREGDGFREATDGELESIGFGVGSDGITVNASDEPVEVTLRKIGIDGAQLAGATFTLSPADGTNARGEANHFADGSTTDVLELTTGEDGVLVSRQLVVGNTYELEETIAPAGYALVSGRFYFTVLDDGTIEVAPAPDGEDVPGEYAVGADGVSVELADPATSLRIAKASADDASTAAMTGAEFEITGVFAGSSSTSSRTLVIGADGTAEVLTAQLVGGKRYQIRETKAPAGYSLLAGTFEIAVHQDGTIVSTGEVDGWMLDMGSDGIATATATDAATFLRLEKFDASDAGDAGNGADGDGAAGTSGDAPGNSAGDAGNNVRLLGGATYQLSGKFAVGDGTVVEATRTLVTRDDGTLLVDGVECDAVTGLVIGQSYTLAEITPPAGYALNTAPATITVKDDGSLVIEGAKDDGSYTVSGEDARTVMASDDRVALGLLKTGLDQAGHETQTGLEGAIFTLEGSFANFETGEVEQGVAHITTLKGGRIHVRIGSGREYEASSLEGLVAGGDYVLTEVEAPSGYLKLDATVTVHVNLDGTLETASGANLVSMSSDGTTVVVANKPVPPAPQTQTPSGRMPHTGDAMRAALYATAATGLMGLAMVLMRMSVGLRRRRRRG